MRKQVVVSRQPDQLSRHKATDHPFDRPFDMDTQDHFRQADLTKGLLTPENILAAQRIHGNSYVRRMIATRNVSSASPAVRRAPKDDKASGGGAPADNSYQRIATDLTSIFETGGKANDITTGDAGLISYGRNQATLAAGTLQPGLDLYIQYAAQSRDANVKARGERMKTFKAQYDLLRNKEKLLKTDPGAAERIEAATLELAGKPGDRRAQTPFIQLLREAQIDPEMLRALDENFSNEYWTDAHGKRGAKYWAKSVGVTSALGYAMLYDNKIHGGVHWDVPNARRRLGAKDVVSEYTVGKGKHAKTKTKTELVGGRIGDINPATNKPITEAEFLQALLDARKERLINYASKNIDSKDKKKRNNAHDIMISATKSRIPAWQAQLDEAEKTGDFNLMHDVTMKGNKVKGLKAGATVDYGGGAPAGGAATSSQPTTGSNAATTTTAHPAANDLDKGMAEMLKSAPKGINAILSDLAAAIGSSERAIASLFTEHKQASHSGAGAGTKKHKHHTTKHHTITHHTTAHHDHPITSHTSSASTPTPTSSKETKATTGSGAAVSAEEQDLFVRAVKGGGITVAAYAGPTVKSASEFKAQAQQFAIDHGAVGLNGDKPQIGKAMELDEQLPTLLGRLLGHIKELIKGHPEAKDTGDGPVKVQSLNIFTHGGQTGLEAGVENGEGKWLSDWGKAPTKQSDQWMKQIAPYISLNSPRLVLYACNTAGDPDKRPFEKEDLTTDLKGSKRLPFAERFRQTIEKELEAENPDKKVSVKSYGHLDAGHTTANNRIAEFSGGSRTSLLHMLGLEYLKQIYAGTERTKDGAFKPTAKELEGAAQAMLNVMREEEMYHGKIRKDSDGHIAYQTGTTSASAVYIREIPYMGLERVVKDVTSKEEPGLEALADLELTAAARKRVFEGLKVFRGRFSAKVAQKKVSG